MLLYSTVSTGPGKRRASSKLRDESTQQWERVGEGFAEGLPWQPIHVDSPLPTARLIVLYTASFIPDVASDLASTGVCVYVYARVCVWYVCLSPWHERW